jgi:D-alanyl-D-alanine carboxypeptidase/D-alanyl-D-alanine-endopeptidase (penicillin-binding protein 4)
MTIRHLLKALPSSRGAALLGLAAALWLAATAASAAAPSAINGLGPRDALLVLDPAGQVVWSHNPEQAMVPASTLKILTSLATLDTLGSNFRFATDFLVDGEGNLVIKGYGDPLLVSEVITGIAHALADRLSHAINHILLDTSYFQGPLTIPGVSTTTNPYDAPIGALCVNFNTVFFTQVKGVYQSAEEQTPLLPMVLKRIRRSGLREGRIVLSHQGDEASLYAGRLFRYFLTKEGVVVRGEVRVAPDAARQARLILRQYSPYALPEVIQRLLKYSNNFTANQLLMAMGAQRYGSPATLAKGVRVLNTYADDEIGIQHGVFVEGSGISRLNRLSVNDMMAVLSRFRPYYDLLTYKNREYFKTGTLKGVRTRAGYIEVHPGEFYRFALFRNQSGKSTAPVMRQIHRALSDRRQ